MYQLIVVSCPHIGGVKVRIPNERVCQLGSCTAGSNTSLVNLSSTAPPLNSSFFTFATIVEAKNNFVLSHIKALNWTFSDSHVRP